MTEVAAGCALLAVPSVVIQALIGSPSNQAARIVGRVLGGALLALGVSAMFPGRTSPDRGVTLAFGVYNTSTTVILVVAGATGTVDGRFPWPAAGLHGILAAAFLAEIVNQDRPAPRSVVPS